MRLEWAVGGLSMLAIVLGAVAVLAYCIGWTENEQMLQSGTFAVVFGLGGVVLAAIIETTRSKP